MTERVINLDWTHVTLLFMLIFGIIGLRNGWQRSLATIISLLGAWAITAQTTDFLIRALNFLIDSVFIGPEDRGLFELLLYMATVVMMVVTFNSRVIPAKVADSREKLAGLVTGLLNGYLFTTLMLELGREWLATHVEDWTLVYNSAISLSGNARTTIITVNFTNNPIEVYQQIATAQNLIILFLLIIFWHGLLLTLLGRLDKKLRPA